MWRVPPCGGECHRVWGVGPDPAPTAYTGLVASAGFTVLDLAMLFTTWTAVRMVMTGGSVGRLLERR